MTLPLYLASMQHSLNTRLHTCLSLYIEEFDTSTFTCACICTFCDSSYNHFVTVKPTIGETENIQTNSVKITFFDPPFLHKAEYNDSIQLRGYTVTHQCYDETLAKARHRYFPYKVNSSTSNTLPTRPHQMKLTDLTSCKKYKLTIGAHYSTGESQRSEEQEFKTKSKGMHLDIVYMVKLACISCIFSHIPIIIWYLVTIVNCFLQATNEY